MAFGSCAGDFEKEILSKLIDLNFDIRDSHETETCHETEIDSDDDWTSSVISYGSDSDDDESPTAKLVNGFKDSWDKETHGHLIYDHSHPTLDREWLDSEENWKKVVDAFEIVQKLRQKYKYDVIVRKFDSARNGVRINEFKIPIGYKSSRVLDELWEEDELRNVCSPYLFQIFVK